jgi:hypothetical protein
MTETQEKITQVFNSIREVIIEKNKKYGDAALAPKPIWPLPKITITHDFSIMI